MKTKTKNKLLISLASGLLALVGVMSAPIFENSARAEETQTPTLNIISNNISYADSVYILYAVMNEGFDRTENEIKMLFWTETQTDYVEGTETLAVSNSGKTTVNEQDCLVFYSEGLAAKQMTDDIYARACVTVDEVTYYSETVKYSVLEYVYEMREKGGLTDEKVALFDAMLAYGTAAQNVFDYNLDRLATDTYYNITVKNGTLSDGFTQGRYKANDTLTLTAKSAAEGYEFSHWKNSNGDVVSEEATMQITVTGAETYTAIYEEVVTEDLEYTLSADGKSYSVTGIGSYPNADIIIPSAYKGLPVTSIADEAFMDSDRVAKIMIPDSVTSIGNYAFVGCGILREVIIGDRVMTIGDGAFANCRNLTDIVIPNSVTSIGDEVFSFSTSLTSIEIGYGLTSIGQAVFVECTSLTTISVALSNTAYASLDNNLYTKDGKTLVQYATGKTDESFTIPDGVTSIASHSFTYCSSLTTVVIPDGMISIGDAVFTYCSNLTKVVIPNSVTSIGRAVFFECENLTIFCEAESQPADWNYEWNSSECPVIWGYSEEAESQGFEYAPSEDGTSYSVISIGGFESDEIVIPSTHFGLPVTSIGDCAFQGIYNLTSVKIPDSVTSIGNSAFESCSNLSSVELSNGVLSIGDCAFASCENLTSVEISNSVTSIGFNAFANCLNLTSVEIPSSVTFMGDFAFTYCMSLTNAVIEAQSIGNNAFESCENLTSVVLGNTVTSIGDNAFFMCRSLTSIEFPDAVESIGASAFMDTGLTSVQIGNGVTSIGNYAFQACASLTSVEISDSVITIGDAAFANCQNLTNVKLGNGVTSIGEAVFMGCTGLTSIEIPDSVESLRRVLFAECANLASVTIGSGVTNIEMAVFANCTALTSITFNGTVEQWNAITKDDTWKDAVPATEVVCSGGVVAL